MHGLEFPSPLSRSLAVKRNGSTNDTAFVVQPLASGPSPSGDDRRVSRLIRKLLKAAVMEEGQVIATRPCRKSRF
jgi:hypothetical protein